MFMHIINNEITASLSLGSSCNWLMKIVCMLDNLRVDKGSNCLDGETRRTTLTKALQCVISLRMAFRR